MIGSPVRMTCCSSPKAAEAWLAAEDVEVRLPDQFLRFPAGRVRCDPARADQEEPALQVLEVHALPVGGQQVAHAGELEFALALRHLRFAPLPGQLDPGHRIPLTMSDGSITYSARAGAATARGGWMA